MKMSNTYKAVSLVILSLHALVRTSAAQEILSTIGRLILLLFQAVLIAMSRPSNSPALAFALCGGRHT